MLYNTTNLKQLLTIKTKSHRNAPNFNKHNTTSTNYHPEPEKPTQAKSDPKSKAITRYKQIQ